MPDLDLAVYLKPITSACPLQAGVLITAARDLQLAVGWIELRPLVLPDTKWAVIIGRKRRDDALRAVLPLPLHTTALKPSELKSIFAALAKLDIEGLPENLPPIAEKVEVLREEYRRRTGDVEGEEGSGEGEVGEEAEEEVEPGQYDSETIYVAIGSTDSTIVYYKLSKGIRKPHDIPDE